MLKPCLCLYVFMCIWSLHRTGVCYRIVYVEYFGAYTQRTRPNNIIVRKEKKTTYCERNKKITKMRRERGKKATHTMKMSQERQHIQQQQQQEQRKNRHFFIQKQEKSSPNHYMLWLQHTFYIVHIHNAQLLFAFTIFIYSLCLLIIQHVNDGDSFVSAKYALFLINFNEYRLRFYFPLLQPWLDQIFTVHGYLLCIAQQFALFVSHQGQVELYLQFSNGFFFLVLSQICAVQNCRGDKTEHLMRHICEHIETSTSSRVTIPWQAPTRKGYCIN